MTVFMVKIKKYQCDRSAYNHTKIRNDLHHLAKKVRGDEDSTMILKIDFFFSDTRKYALWGIGELKVLAKMWSLLVIKKISLVRCFTTETHDKIINYMTECSKWAQRFYNKWPRAFCREIKSDDSEIRSLSLIICLVQAKLIGILMYEETV